MVTSRGFGENENDYGSWERRGGRVPEKYNVCLALWRGINYVHLCVNRDERGRRIAARQNVDLTGGLLDGVKGLGDSVIGNSDHGPLGLLVAAMASRSRSLLASRCAWLRCDSNSGRIR